MMNGTLPSEFATIQALLRPAQTKIALLVIDGLGGLPYEPGGPTELEAAIKPNLNALAAGGICGLHHPVGYGITPGSGPSHLSLFGYNPLRYDVGRGVLAALGVGFDLQSGDVAARGNFATQDESEAVTDRRAGRISTDTNRQLVERLRQIELNGVELFVETIKEHRFLLVLRGEGLSGQVTNTDPQMTGKRPLEARPLEPGAAQAARLVNEFAAQARRILQENQPANGVLLRGFSQHPDWPQLPDVFGINPVAIAAYPMYRGVARLVGMQALNVSDDLDASFDLLEARWDDYDFFFIHVKGADSAGEDGDFERKVATIEAVDEQIPRLMNLKPDVVIVTGDHSTPAVLKEHSWHPVPVLLWSPLARPDTVERFTEIDCTLGSLGTHLPAYQLMPLALAHARRLNKFGA